MSPEINSRTLERKGKEYKLIQININITHIVLKVCGSS